VNQIAGRREARLLFGLQGISDSATKLLSERRMDRLRSVRSPDGEIAVKPSSAFAGSSYVVAIRIQHRGQTLTLRQKSTIDPRRHRPMLYLIEIYQT